VSAGMSAATDHGQGLGCARVSGCGGAELALTSRSLCSLGVFTIVKRLPEAQGTSARGSWSCTPSLHPTALLQAPRLNLFGVEGAFPAGSAGFGLSPSHPQYSVSVGFVGFFSCLLLYFCSVENPLSLLRPQHCHPARSATQGGLIKLKKITQKNK